MIIRAPTLTPSLGAQHGAGKLEVVPRVKRFIYTVLQPKTMAGLSFPPLLESWKGASQGRQFPGSQETWKKALQPRPLRHTPSEQTVHDIQMACGPNFKLVQQATQIGDEFVRRDGAPPPSMQAPPARPPGMMRSKMPLYDTVWPDTTPPNFSVWDYCKKVGHAPPPNSLPAPRVTDMKSWFQTYGRPEPNAPPGVYSEFTSTAKSVPRGDGMATAQVKLYRGRVLR